MGRAWSNLGTGLAAWWRDVFDYFFLNLLWLAFSLSVIGLPPALAAMYQVAAYSLDRDPYVDWRRYLGAMRQHFWAAWRWALLQTVIYGVGIFNLLYYAFHSGEGWIFLRIVWISTLALWTVLNLFYWPFFLQQADQRILNTYRNVLVMCALHPGQVVMVVIMVLVFGTFSVLTGILLTFIMMPIIALTTTATVHSVLYDKRKTGT